MDVEVKNKANRRHVGHNLQKIRVYFGMKQEALAADLGVNQQVISKIEKQEEIEEGLLNQIASVLGISAEVIKDFDVEKAIYNINNIRDNTFEQGATSIAQQFNPLDKIVELYERLLQSEREKMELLQMDPSYAERDLNVGFSGGEKKKAEILQMLMLKPELAILDETDSGLDVDAVRTVSKGIEEYQKSSKGSLLIITHSTKILEALHVDYTHIMVEGHIVKTADASLIDEVNENGFAKYE